jgi:hypothetical protein
MAEIRAVKPGLLVITQTQAVHDDIRNLLATVHKMREASSPTLDGAADPARNDKVVTRFYPLQLNPNREVETMRSQVRDLIIQSLPEETWSGQLDDGQGVALTVFHDRIVVRHKPSVQEKVRQILADSGIAASSSMTIGPTFVPNGSPAALGPEGGPGPATGLGDAPSPGPEGEPAPSRPEGVESNPFR